MEDPAAPCSAQTRLKRFLETGQRLDLPTSESPEASIIVAARSSAGMLFRCLEALSRSEAVSLEVVLVVDDRIGRDFEPLLDRLEKAVVLRLPRIESLAEAWNRGAQLARSDCLVVLKDDVCVREGALASMIASLSSTDKVGAVGAMLLDAGGALMEAGSGLNADGWCQSYGRGWNADDYRVQYRREVAFCSGACLGLRKAVFDSVGGFSEAYLDEYYEDVDLCLKIRRLGGRIVYNPGCAAVRMREHRYPWSQAVALMEKNRSRFVQAWKEELARIPQERQIRNEPFFEYAEGRRILWIEDAPPFAHMGAGFPRTREMLAALIELGHSVSLLPTFVTTSSYEDVYRDTPREVEVVLGIGVEGFESFWQKRKDLYDTVILSRPNNLRDIGSVVAKAKAERPELRFLYDAEAIFANREISERRFKGETVSDREEREMLEEELAQARTADAVFAISEHERKQFENLGFRNVIMLRHHSLVRPTPRPYEERRDILFVGAVHSDTAPNALGLINFIEKTLPLVRARLGQEIKLYCAGKYHSKRLLDYASDSEVFLGFVEELDEWYDRCRLFIAPAQFAAGIPLKIIEAASRGIPVVGTGLARSQLGWSEREMLSADSPDEFAEACAKLYNEEPLWQQLREGALANVRETYSHEHIVDALRRSLD